MKTNKLLQKCRDTKYRTKLNIALMLAGIIPIFILGVTLFTEFQKIVGDEESTNMKTSLLQATTSVENQVARDDLMARYIVFNDGLNSALALDGSERYEKYKMYTQTVKPLLTTIRYFATDMKGITVYSSGVTTDYGSILRPLRAFKEQKWFGLVQDAPGFQWILDSTQKDTMLSVCKVSNYQGQNNSYLTIQYDMHSFLQPLVQMKQKNADVAVFQDNHILYVSGTADKGFTTSQEEFCNSIRTSRICLQHHIDGLNWDVYLYTTNSSLSAAAQLTAARTLAMLGVSLLVLLIFGRLLSHTMTRRIEALTQNMVSVSTGNMKVTVTSRENDEIGIMIQNFRRMIAKIDQLIHQVYESQLAQKEAELKALQSQINPHFLYNTLSMINWKALAAGEKDISRITLALSKFYRTTLNKGKSLLTAADELKNIRSYLEIQLMMHDNNFTVSWDIDEAVYPYTMPKLILQPIVENALEHGLDVKETGERSLAISAQQTKSDIVFTVRDNGVGMTQEKADSIINCETTGYGMKNVNDRIVMLYGSTHALKISSSPGCGTVVSVYIPQNGKEERST